MQGIISPSLENIIKITFSMSAKILINGDNNTVSVTNPTAHSEDATVDLVEPKFGIDGKLILPPDFFVYGKKDFHLMQPENGKSSSLL